MRLTGKVIYFSQRGYGFLAADSPIEGSRHKEFFLHVTDITRQQTLPAGTRVSFEIGPPTPRHPWRAVRVELLDRCSAVKL
jgi:cold shock CspA family protein